jgi:hypothetical protein
MEAPVMNPSFSDIVTIFSIILGVTGALALAVSYLFWKKLQDIETSLQAIKNNNDSEHTRLDTGNDSEHKRLDVQYHQLNDRVYDIAKDLGNKLDGEIKLRMEKHEELAKRVFTDVGQVKEDLSDLSVTVSGFSGSYVTRSEFIQHSQENIGFLEKLAKNQKS